MLQGLSISNYQTHIETNIEFDKGMNVITGVSSHGKTAIVRAVIWALNGKPLGDSFRSWSAKEKDNVEVSMEFDNGWFTKSRIKDKNQYTCDAGKFEALRTDVPEIIQNIANMQDYNLMTQHEPFFMLQMSPGDRAKKLNDLVGLSIMDTVIKKLNSKVTKAKSSINEISGQINTLTDELKDLKYLDVAAPQIQKLDDDITKYEVTSSRVDLMRSLSIKLQEIEEQIRSYDKVLKLETLYFDLMLKIKDYQDEDIEHSHLFSAKDQLIKINDSLTHWSNFLKVESIYEILTAKIDIHTRLSARTARLKTYVKTLKDITDDLQADKEWLSVEEPYNKLLAKINAFGELANTENNLQKYAGNLDKLTVELIDKKQILDGKIIDYTDLLEKSGTCPTCTHKIDTKTVKQIKDKLQEV